jgi:hypothetical protein
MEDSQVNALVTAIEDSRVSITSLDELVTELRGIRDALDRVHSSLERIADQNDS